MKTGLNIKQLSHTVFYSNLFKYFIMSVLTNVDTTTFVLVTLLLFFIYNAGVFVWFKFFSGEKGNPSRDKDLLKQFESSESDSDSDTIDDLPF